MIPRKEPGIRKAALKMTWKKDPLLKLITTSRFGDIPLQGRGKRHFMRTNLGRKEGKSVKICMKRILFVAAPASVRLLQT